MPVRHPPKSFPWNQLVVGLFAVILFVVWWSMRGREADDSSTGLSPEERAEIIEQEQAIDRERSFLNDTN